MSVFEIVLHQGRANLKYENEARLDGGLKVAERMHWWMRHAERVKMATYLYPTNTWAPLLRTSGGDLLRTPQYHALSMLAAHREAEGTAVETAGGRIDAAASTGNGKLTVSLLNQEERPVRTTVRAGAVGQPRVAAAAVLTGDPGDENSFEAPDRVVPRDAEVSAEEGTLTLSCEPHSLTVIQCELTP